MSDPRGPAPSSQPPSAETPPGQAPSGETPTSTSIFKSPAIWIILFFAVLITLNAIFFWVAGSNPPDFSTP